MAAAWHANGYIRGILCDATKDGIIVAAYVRSYYLCHINFVGSDSFAVEFRNELQENVKQ